MISLNTTARCCLFLFTSILLAPSISSARYTDIDVQNGGFCGVLPSGQAECVGREFSDPTQLTVDPDERYTTVQSGNQYSCGLTTGGLIDCWGEGPQGEGQTNPPTFDTPVVSLSVGPFHACAIDSQSIVKCWGQNVHGQTEPPEPINNFVDVEAFGIFASCGVKRSGRVLCWGRFETTYFLPDFRFSSDSPVSKIHSAERFAGSGANQIRCVTRQDETVQCFTNNRGDQVVSEFSNGPYKDVELFGARGGLSVCALTFNGELDCARLVNDDGTTDRIPLPVERSSISYAAIATDRNSLFALTQEGRLTAIDNSLNTIVPDETAFYAARLINTVNGELDIPTMSLDGAEFYGVGVGLELFFDIRGVGSVLSYDTQIFRDGVLLDTTDNATSYLDTTVEANTEYSYTIRLIHRYGQTGEFSEPVVVSTDANAPEDGANQPVPDPSTRPNKPTGLRAEVYWFDVELFWDRNQSGQVEKYEIRRNGELVGVSRGTSWYDDSTANGQQYQFDVIALGPNDEFLGMESTNVQIGEAECRVE